MDLLYLHNPVEMQLQALGQQGFMDQMREAFTWAEGARKRGLIRAYGLATWDCFRTAPGSGGYVSLLSLVQLAQQVGGLDHGLRYSPSSTGHKQGHCGSHCPCMLCSQ